MVATGGGTNDHTVRIWNLATGALHSTHNTYSQVILVFFIIILFIFFLFRSVEFFSIKILKK